MSLPHIKTTRTDLLGKLLPVVSKETKDVIMEELDERKYDVPTRRLFIGCQLLQHDNCTREFHFKGEHHICTCKCHGNS